MSKVVLGVDIERRRNIATEVQEILTEYGCFIKTRIGLHEVSDDRQFCSENGLVLLELIRDAGNEGDELEEKLGQIEGITVKKMEF
jgi:hypothetical protein